MRPCVREGEREKESKRRGPERKVRGELDVDEDDDGYIGVGVGVGNG